MISTFILFSLQPTKLHLTTTRVEGSVIVLDNFASDMLKIRMTNVGFKSKHPVFSDQYTMGTCVSPPQRVHDVQRNVKGNFIRAEQSQIRESLYLHLSNFTYFDFSLSNSSLSIIHIG